MGEDAFMNDIFDNTFMDCTDWAMESLSEKIQLYPEQYGKHAHPRYRTF